MIKIKEFLGMTTALKKIETNFFFSILVACRDMCEGS